jgi:threonine/homoserine/homoserine lactone efflux protein
MSTEVYLAFVLAAGIVLILPGPTIVLVVSQSIAHGRKAVWPLVCGVTLGDFTAMTLSLAGLGAAMAASAALFTVLKWIGAIYLVFLGLGLWFPRSSAFQTGSGQQHVHGRSFFRSAFFVTAFNPKSIAFFVAFLPQFVVPVAPALPQLLALGSTFLVMATVNATLYGLFAGRLRDILRRAGVQRWLDRCSGTALIGAGVFTAALDRSS